MITNCLVTKLKGVVDNDNLWKIGETRLPVKNGTINISVGNTLVLPTITGLGGVLLDGDSSKVLNVGWNNNIAISGLAEGAIGYISIPDKYIINGILGSSSIDLSNADFDRTFGYMPLTQLSVLYANTQLSNVVALGNITVISIYDGIHGSVRDLFPIKDYLSSVVLGSVGATDFSFSGTFEEYGHLYKINSIPSNMAIVMKLAGNVEGFVANRLLNESAEKTITVKSITEGGRIKFGGKPINNLYGNSNFVAGGTWDDDATANALDNVLNWDTSGHIVLGGKSTIASATTLFVKGYTTEEVAANIANESHAWYGKSVIRVEDIPA